MNLKIKVSNVVDVQAMTDTAGPQDIHYSLATTPPIEYVPSAEIDFMRASLTEIADHFKTDKGSLDHNYTEVYRQYFDELRHEPNLSLLEIGVACGSSLKMWAHFFADAKITGVDIRPECASLCKTYPNITIRIGDATKQAFGKDFDIIIDDGSHVAADIVDTFRLTWPTLKPGGIYVVEDTRCTHDSMYPKVAGIETQPERLDRGHFLALIDKTLIEMDWQRSDVEWVHLHSNLAIFKKAQGSHVGNVEELLANAHNLFTNGRLTEAEAIMRQVVAAQPGHGKAWFYIGMINRDLNRPAEALRALERAVELGVQHPALLPALAALR